jgi:hypothetical protein
MERHVFFLNTDYGDCLHMPMEGLRVVYLTHLSST